MKQIHILSLSLPVISSILLSCGSGTPTDWNDNDPITKDRYYRDSVKDASVAAITEWMNAISAGGLSSAAVATGSSSSGIPGSATVLSSSVTYSVITQPSSTSELPIEESSSSSILTLPTSSSTSVIRPSSTTVVSSSVRISSSSIRLSSSIAPPPSSSVISSAVTPSSGSQTGTNITLTPNGTAVTVTAGVTYAVTTTCTGKLQITNDGEISVSVNGGAAVTGSYFTDMPIPGPSFSILVTKAKELKCY